MNERKQTLINEDFFFPFNLLFFFLIEINLIEAKTKNIQEYTYIQINYFIKQYNNKKNDHHTLFLTKALGITHIIYK
jgi:hypothetical protein